MHKLWPPLLIGSSLLVILLMFSSIRSAPWQLLQKGQQISVVVTESLAAVGSLFLLGFKL